MSIFSKITFALGMPLLLNPSLVSADMEAIYDNQKRAIKHFSYSFIGLPQQVYKEVELTCSQNPYTELIGYRHSTGILLTSLSIKRINKSSWIFGAFNVTSPTPADIHVEIVCAAPKGSQIKPNYLLTWGESETLSVPAWSQLQGLPRHYICIGENSKILGIYHQGSHRAQHYLSRKITYATSKSQWILHKLHNEARKPPQGAVERFSIKFGYFCGDPLN